MDEIKEKQQYNRRVVLEVAVIVKTSTKAEAIEIAIKKIPAALELLRVECMSSYNEYKNLTFDK